MQNAKDTFYTTLQARLAALNPARTLVLRGQIRPGVLVDENELPTAAPPTDAFRLQWTGLAIDSAGPLPLVTLTCTIEYATDGTAAHGSIDRGRQLAAMDAELATALAAAPHYVTKMDYTKAAPGTAPTPMQTCIFWSAPIFAATKAQNDRLTRSATVQVFAFQERGEL